MRFRLAHPVSFLASAIVLAAASTLAVPAEGVGQQRGTEVYGRTFDASATPRVEVDVADADVRVETHPGTGVEVRVTAHADSPEDGYAFFEATEFEARAEGRTVRIEARDPDMGAEWWRRGRWAGITIWVSAPGGSDVDVRTSDGDIEMADLTGNVSLRSSDGDVVVGDVEGDVEVRTSDGDILAGRISGASARLQTSDGDIRVESMYSDEAMLQSSDGDVDVAFAGRSLEARSGDGNLTVELLAEADVRLRTGDGDIVVWAPEGYSADVSLEGEDLDVEQEMRLRGRISEGRITGTLNEGGSVLEATTGDGSVSLRTRARQVR